VRMNRDESIVPRFFRVWNVIVFLFMYVLASFAISMLWVSCMETKK